MSGVTKEELDLFGIEVDQPEKTAGQLEQERINNAVPTRKGSSTSSIRNANRRHADKMTLYRLYSLMHTCCATCGNQPELEDLNMLSMTNASTMIYRFHSRSSGSVNLTRKIIQGGAPPLWVYLCRPCHSRISTAKIRPSNNAIVARFGVSFEEWSKQVTQLALTSVLPAYILRGGALNREYVAMGIIKGLRIPEPEESLDSWWREIRPEEQAEVVRYMNRALEPTDGITQRGTGVALTKATELESFLLRKPGPAEATDAISEIENFDFNVISVRSATREDVISHYTEGKNTCMNCDSANVADLRIVCVDGEAAQIRQAVNRQFRRLLIKKLAQAGFPPEVKILCTSCHTSLMRTSPLFEEF